MTPANAAPYSSEPTDSTEDAGIPRQPASPSVEEAPENEPIAAPDGSDEQVDVDTSGSGPARIRSHIRPGNATQSVPIEDAQLETDPQPGTETDTSR